MAQAPAASEAHSTENGAESEGFRPTRRQVVIGAGVAAGAAALASTPFLRGMLTSLARAVNPAVGVIAPPSTRYPGLLGQLEAGVRAGLAAGGRRDAPVLAREASSSAPSAVASAARRLIEHDRVDLVLAYANPTQTDLLGKVAEETGVPIIIVDPGAHIVSSVDADDRVFSHSLGYWQSVWSLGSWSVTGVGRTTFVISSLYESGFDIARAFEHGVVSAGGSVIGTAVTHAAPDVADVPAAVRKAVASGADAFFIAASGTEAADILAAIAADKAASSIPLLLPGLSASHLAAAPGLSAFTALTWPIAEKSAFQMLGEDVGALVANAVEGGRDALPSGNTAIVGARGDVTLDLATGRSDVAVSIHEATAGSKGVAMKVRSGSLSTADASAHADDIVCLPRTGWLDVYGSTL